jgi:DNA-binding XRE family transcriptional regulator
MTVDIDYSSLPKFPQKLPEKLKQIRERTGLTPEEFAPQVNAKDGEAIVKYESGQSDLPAPVLMGYWKLSDVPLENILNDDRDLWLGHRVN